MWDATLSATAPAAASVVTAPVVAVPEPPKTSATVLVRFVSDTDEWTQRRVLKCRLKEESEFFRALMEDHWSKDGDGSEPLQVHGVGIAPARAIFEYLMFDSSSVISVRLNKGLLDLIDYLRMDRLLNVLKADGLSQPQAISWQKNKRRRV